MAPRISSGASNRGTGSARANPARGPRASFGAAAPAADARPASPPAPTRSSRRRSLDPYARPPPLSASTSASTSAAPASEAGPPQPKAGARTRRRRSVQGRSLGEDVSGADAAGASPHLPASVEEQEAEEEDAAGAGVGQEGADLGARAGAAESKEVGGEAARAAAHTSTDQSFEMVVLQQPDRGAAAGMSQNTLGRLPIVPAPIVQVIVRNSDGEPVDVDLPFLFCSCSLRHADGVTPVELAAESDAEGGDFSALIGSLVRNAQKVTGLDGSPMTVFVFEDMSVRGVGTYTLEFRLGEANVSRPPKSPKLAAAVSDPFDVVEWGAYPGRPAADILTPLSRHLRSEGVPIYIPPLVLSPPYIPPPPAGSNPFHDLSDLERTPSPPRR